MDLNFNASRKVCKFRQFVTFIKVCYFNDIDHVLCICIIDAIFFYYLYLFQSFDEYMKKVSDILSQKLSAIQLLQDQIIAYQLSIQDAET